MKLWIQRHNFESSDEIDATFEEALKALKSYDWINEVTLQNNAEYDTCDAGLGLIREDKSILHICPVDTETCMIHFHAHVTKKWLFIPVSSIEYRYLDSLAMSEVDHMVKLFFESADSDIRKKYHWDKL